MKATTHPPSFDVEAIGVRRPWEPTCCKAVVALTMTTRTTSESSVLDGRPRDLSNPRIAEVPQASKLLRDSGAPCGHLTQRSDDLNPAGIGLR